MNFIDTHCHLDAQVRYGKNVNFETPLSEIELQEIGKIVQEAQTNGVSKLVCVGTSVVESLNAIAIAHTYDAVRAVIGLHPTSVHSSWRNDLKEFKKMLIHDELGHIVAVGETGIDLFRDESKKEDQKDLFKAHIELALEHNKPLVMHVRDHIGSDRSIEIVFDILAEYGSSIRGVIHCFQQSRDAAVHAVKQGLLLGIDAPIGYPKNEWLRDAVRAVSLESLVLETDAPFLPPHDMRGKPNGQYAISYIGQQIAQIKGVALHQVAEQTTKNAAALFKL